MANLTFDGKRLFFPGGGILDYTVNTLPIGVINWDGTNDYVQLSSQPDLSGTKRVEWNMWLDNESGYSSDTVFTLGATENNMFVELSSTNLTIGNANNETVGTLRQFSLSGLSGKKLEVIAVKSTDFLEWVQINGYGYYLNPNTGGFANRSADVSRFGAGGATSPSNYLSNAYVWNIEVISEGSWSGYGTDANVNSGWVDTIGSSNGTVNGSPTIKELNLIDPTYNDWYVPSQGEFGQIYTNLYQQSVGGLSGAYWTSSEYSSTQSYVWSVASGFSLQTNKTSYYKTRPIRTFTDSIGAYSLRDTGPAGGLIFYVDGTTYYECSPQDQTESDGTQWSNITSTSIGTTGTAIGDGQSNTTEMLNQSGHLYSVALIADKYFV